MLQKGGKSFLRDNFPDCEGKIAFIIYKDIEHSLIHGFDKTMQSEAGVKAISEIIASDIKSQLDPNLENLDKSLEGLAEYLKETQTKSSYLALHWIDNSRKIHDIKAGTVFISKQDTSLLSNIFNKAANPERAKELAKKFDPLFTEMHEIFHALSHVKGDDINNNKGEAAHSRECAADSFACLSIAATNGYKEDVKEYFSYVAQDRLLETKGKTTWISHLTTPAIRATMQALDTANKEITITEAYDMAVKIGTEHNPFKNSLVTNKEYPAWEKLEREYQQLLKAAPKI